MITAKEIYNFVENLYPLASKSEGDNCGFLAGCLDVQVTKVLLALDITTTTIDQAISLGAQLIISHHPLIFNSILSVTQDTPDGGRIIKLLANGISAICMHTNLDSSPGGINQTLAQVLGLENITFCTLEDARNGFGIGRVGNLARPQTLSAFLNATANALGCNGLRYHDSGKDVCKVMVGGGACGYLLKGAAALGCDTMVTADLRHDLWLAAREYGINLIDAGHYHTENVFANPLKATLEKQFSGVEFFVAETAHPCKFAIFND